MHMFLTDINDFSVTVSKKTGAFSAQQMCGSSIRRFKRDVFMEWCLADKSNTDNFVMLSHIS